MSPIARAEALFNQQNRTDEIFIAQLMMYLRFGYVISTPQLFIMFRPVEIAAAPEQIADPEHRFARPDAWFIHSAVGKLQMFPRLAPYPLPWICFWRKLRGAIRRYETQNLFKRIRLCHQ